MAIAMHHCKSEQQDAIHGKQMRVVNPINKSTQNGTVQRYRCTVCGLDVDKELVFKGKGK